MHKETPVVSTTDASSEDRFISSLPPPMTPELSSLYVGLHSSRIRRGDRPGTTTTDSSQVSGSTVAEFLQSSTVYLRVMKNPQPPHQEHLLITYPETMKFDEVADAALVNIKLDTHDLAAGELELLHHMLPLFELPLSIGLWTSTIQLRRRSSAQVGEDRVARMSDAVQLIFAFWRRRRVTYTWKMFSGIRGGLTWVHYRFNETDEVRPYNCINDTLGLSWRISFPYSGDIGRQEAVEMLRPIVKEYKRLYKKHQRTASERDGFQEQLGALQQTCESLRLSLREAKQQQEMLGAKHEGVLNDMRRSLSQTELAWAEVNRVDARLESTFSDLRTPLVSDWTARSLREESAHLSTQLESAQDLVFRLCGAVPPAESPLLPQRLPMVTDVGVGVDEPPNVSPSESHCNDASVARQLQNAVRVVAAQYTAHSNEVRHFLAAHSDLEKRCAAVVRELEEARRREQEL
ncbi:MAG: LOW QUALITY PROTEIN: uncharacterized protein KVP18_002674 [Porospora cf. gigantea A]|uniref:uncharacterized protein n=1 Tax=Porospora cf. gigantea A TaxID=2853593 RepID=UPI00355A9A47|nr:MAG: LOW QUALITY PROTEIN: hypothetical protein KVP18_002674 [Porospora cf. gigantea A]